MTLCEKCGRHRALSDGPLCSKCRAYHLVHGPAWGAKIPYADPARADIDRWCSSKGKPDSGPNGV